MIGHRQRHRLKVGGFIFCCAALAVFAIVKAFSEQINFFYTPSELVAQTSAANEQAPLPKSLKLGGMVVTGSVQRIDALNVVFDLTDFQATVTVHYQGILPDLFREGQGIVTIGGWESDHFEAKTVLAKHDESYMPPALAGLSDGD